jgi:hypothetical protein
MYFVHLCRLTVADPKRSRLACGSAVLSILPEGSSRSDDLGLPGFQQGCALLWQVLRLKNTLIRKGKAKIKSKIQKGYHIDSLLDNFGIILYTEEKEIDLCPKCRKEFKEWMKNE